MVMNKLTIVVILILLTAGCQKNAQLKAVLKDFKSTPRCDVLPVFTHAKDTKESLKAKTLILNYKVACFKDWYYYFDEKLKSYKKF